MKRNREKSAAAITVAVVLILIWLVLTVCGICVIVRQEHRIREQVDRIESLEAEIALAGGNGSEQQGADRDPAGQLSDSAAADLADGVSAGESADDGSSSESADGGNGAASDSGTGESGAREDPLTEGMDDLKAQLENIIDNYEGDWSIYVRDLSGEEYLSINDHAMKAASLIKLFIMATVYEKIDEGTLEQTAEIDNLLNQMITVSHNESSNELVRRLSESGTDHAEGMTVVNDYAAANGYIYTSQGRDLRDFREVPAEGENYTSAADCGRLLEQIYDGTCVSEEASSEMLELLKNQQRTWKIPAGLPQGIVSANKTGELADTENDTAIIYGQQKDYILCVMAQDLPDTSDAQNRIVQISTYVYDYLN